MQINAFGDSITSGLYVTSPQCYINLLANRFSANVANYSFSGDMAMDQAYKIETVAPSDLQTIMVGPNDTYWYQTNSTKLNSYIRYLRALTVIQAGINYVSGRNITKTGSWSNITASGNNLGAYTDQVGATATMSVNGTSVYIGYIQFGSAGGDPTFEVWIDGVKVDTVTPDGAATGASQNGRIYSNACLRYGGLTNATHTVMVKNIGSVRFHLSFIGGNEAPFRKPVYVANILYQTGYGGTNSATNIDNYSSAVSNMIYELYSDNLLVYLVDVKGLLNLSTDMHDSIHPNAAGHVKIYNKFLDTILASLPLGGSTPPVYPTGPFTITLPTPVNYTHCSGTWDGAGGITGSLTLS